MAIPLLVVDANILVSALLKDSTTRRIFLGAKKPGLVAPEFIKEEFLEHLDEFSERLNVKKKRLEGAVNALLKEIRLIPTQEYKGFLPSAIKISPDKKDAPYFALALCMNCPIWSQDKALKNQKEVRVYSTHGLLELLPGLIQENQ